MEKGKGVMISFVSLEQTLPDDRSTPPFHCYESQNISFSAQATLNQVSARGQHSTYLTNNLAGAPITNESEEKLIAKIQVPLDLCIMTESQSWFLLLTRERVLSNIGKGMKVDYKGVNIYSKLTIQQISCRSLLTLCHILFTLGRVGIEVNWIIIPIVQMIKLSFKEIR